jgi:uncharacterized membrane protein
MNSRTSINTGKMVRMAVLVAIIILMSFTPLGYLKLGVIEISFLMLPVAIAGIILGPGAGAFMGGVFGLTSFIQCFGMSAFGAALLNINPIFTFILCMVPRILAGWLPGLVFKAFSKSKYLRFFGAFVSSLLAAVLNTVFFVGGLILLFGNSDYIKSFGETAWDVVVLLVGVNALLEAIVCTIVGGAVGIALLRFLPVKEKTN